MNKESRGKNGFPLPFSQWRHSRRMNAYNTSTFTSFMEETMKTQREGGPPLLSLDYSPEGEWADANFTDGSGWRLVDTKTTHRIHFHGLPDAGETTNFKKLRYSAEIHTLTLRKKKKTKTITGGLTIALEEIRPRRTLPESIVRATIALALTNPPSEGYMMVFVDLDPDKKKEDETTDDPQ